MFSHLWMTFLGQMSAHFQELVLWIGRTHISGLCKIHISYSTINIKYNGPLTGIKYVDQLHKPLADFLDDYALFVDLTKKLLKHNGVPAYKDAPSRIILHISILDHRLQSCGRMTSLILWVKVLWIFSFEAFLKSKVYEVELVRQRDLQHHFLSLVRCINACNVQKCWREISIVCPSMYFSQRHTLWAWVIKYET